LCGAGPLLRDEPGDATREHGGLAGSSPGNDQERTVAVRDCLALPRGQVGEERRLQAKVRTAGARRWSGELLEDRELVRRRDDRWHELDGRRERIHPVVI